MDSLAGFIDSTIGGEWLFLIEKNIYLDNTNEKENIGMKTSYARSFPAQWLFTLKADYEILFVQFGFPAI